MSEPGSTHCLTCGQDAGPKAFLNRLPTGELCPTCHERVLESLPSLLPSTDEAVVSEAEEVPAPAEFGLRLLSDPPEFDAEDDESPTAG